MAQSYLNRFRSSLPTTQGNQILKLLISKRDSGEIRTIDEFKNRLKSLTQELLAERITPTLKLFYAVGGKDIGSEEYNEMLARVRDDLEAAFAEANNIDEVTTAHHNIIDNVALKALRFSVNELDSRVTLYEFLNRNTQGFDEVQFNTFRESQNLQTSRSEPNASLVYKDFKENEAIDSSQDSRIDFLGERLMLNSSSEFQLSVRDVTWLANSNSIRSELDVTFPNSRIQNIIDNQNNTYWVIPILLAEVRKAGVPMEIMLKLNSSQDLNFVEIEPATNYPLKLVDIDYIDTNNTRQSLSISELTLRGPVKVNFQKITASALILRFQQDNYNEIQFTQRPGESNFHKAVLGQSIDTIDLNSVSEDLRDILSSDFILTDVVGLTSPTLTRYKYYEYILGFDNIKVGFSTFEDKGIFVSKKISVEDLGQVGLKTTEVRPVQVSGSSNITLESFAYPAQDSDEDSKFYHSSIEYWLTCQMFTDDNLLIDTIAIPLLPIGASRIYHERLIFTQKSISSVQNADLASLMFFTDPDPDDVKIYRNGTLLTYGNDSTKNWEFVASVAGQQDTDDNTLIAVDASITNPTASSTPMKRGIRIWDTVSPLDIYTVSYTPKISNTRIVPVDPTLFQVIDLSGNNTIRMTKDNIAIFDSIRNSLIIKRVDLYLSILFRRNSADVNFSPILEDYMLVIGKKNKDKFLTE